MTDTPSSSLFARSCRFCKLTSCSLSLKRDIALTFFRLALGAMMLVHGYPKLLLLVKGEGASWLDPLGIGASFSLFLCVLAEVVASIAIILGLCTRPAALLLAINCWIIVFVFYAEASWTSKELPFLYFICYLALVGLGAGRFSMDHCLLTRVFNKHNCSICS